jgi:hypothetical protein
MEPMLSAVQQQLAGGVVPPQQCKQLAAVIQEVEASFRAVWCLMHQHTFRTVQPAASGDVSQMLDMMTSPLLDALSTPLVQSSRVMEQLSGDQAEQQHQQQQLPTADIQSNFDGWAVLSGTVHGQQLLQAWLSAADCQQGIQSCASCWGRQQGCSAEVACLTILCHAASCKGPESTHWWWPEAAAAAAGLQSKCQYPSPASPAAGQCYPGLCQAALWAVLYRPTGACAAARRHVQPHT